MMSSVNGDYRKDMLRSHYDYLQFSYYKREYISDENNAGTRFIELLSC